MILVDSWAWIEYFKGTSSGKAITGIVENESAYTSSISLAEISAWFYKNNKNPEKAIENIKVNSSIIFLEEAILVESGRRYVELRNHKKDIGLIDAIIYTTARMHGLDLLTGDADFRDLPAVRMVSK